VCSMCNFLFMHELLLTISKKYSWQFIVASNQAYCSMLGLFLGMRKVAHARAIEVVDIQYSSSS
jgi:hypothetical protein